MGSQLCNLVQEESYYCECCKYEEDVLLVDSIPDCHCRKEYRNYADREVKKGLARNTFAPLKSFDLVTNRKVEILQYEISVKGRPVN